MKEIYKIARVRLPLVIVVLLLGPVIAVVESFGITFFLPLLSGGQSSDLSVPLIGNISQSFADLTSVERIHLVAFTLILTALLRGFLVYFQKLFSEFLQTAVEFDLRRDLFRQVLSLSPEYIEKSSVGEYTTKIMSSAPIIGSVVLQFSMGVSAVLQAAIFTGMLMLLSVPLTLLALFTVGCAFLIIKVKFKKRLSTLSRELHSHQIDLNQSAMEMVSAIRFIHLAGLKDAVVDQAEQQSFSYLNFCRKSKALLVLVDPLFSTAMAMVIGGVLLAIPVIAQGDPQAYVPLALLFMFVLFRLSTPVMNIVNARTFIDAYWHYVEEATEFLSPDGKPYPTDGAQEPPEHFSAIEMTGVTFKYDGAEKNALDQVSLIIPSGQITALVGESGSGKSTLLGVIGRLYDPQFGEVLVDGVRLSALKTKSWRKQLFVVTQDSYLFFDSIRANLLMAKPDASEGELWEAIEGAAAAAFIKDLPKGLDTVIGDRGLKLSGGQRQRLSLARALLAKPKILILDEATSQLDSETEKYIQETIRRLKGKVTLLIVAHRLSTIRDADSIYVLKDGKVIESGDHEGLMRESGYYSRLVEAQSQGRQHV